MVSDAQFALPALPLNQESIDKVTEYFRFLFDLAVNATFYAASILSIAECTFEHPYRKCSVSQRPLEKNIFEWRLSFPVAIMSIRDCFARNAVVRMTARKTSDIQIF